MTPAEHRERLAAFLSSITRGRDFGRAGGAMELDSLALLLVVTYLELNYGIRLAEHQIEPDDLRSVDGLLSIVERFA